MISFPPELHSYICAFACSDGGYTVQALSLVSRYFRDIARPYLYQSLSLSGVDQIMAAAVKLENTPVHLRRVQHLFISDESQRRNDHQLGKRICDMEATSIVRIITFAAPTLQTLAFVTTCPLTGTSLIGRLFRILFPSLRELTVSGFYPFPSSPGKMPLLERLHLNGNRNPHGLLQVGALENVCPSLTHLRVSGLALAASFAQELEESLNPDELSMFPSNLPPHMREIIIQPSSSPPMSGKPSTAQVKDRTMMIWLEQAQCLSSSTSVRLSLLPRRETEMLPNDVRKGWFSRLHGGNGCWA